MFGLGVSEIITLAIVIIVLLNPKDLPIIVRKIGKIYGRIMRQINGIKKAFYDFEQELKTISDIQSSGKLITGKEKKDQTTEGEIK